MNKYILAIREYLENLAKSYINELLKLFKSSMRTVQGEITDLLLDYIEDGKINVPLNKRQMVLMKITNVLREEAQALGQKDVETTTQILHESASSSYYRTAFVIESGLDNPSELRPLDESDRQAIVNTPVEGEMFSSRIWSNKDKLIKRVRLAVEQSMRNGTDPQKLARQVKKEFNVSAYQSRRLINTELARIDRQAQDLVYEQEGVEEVMFDATLDRKTSNYCRNHDGNIYPLNDKPILPAHPNCRSDYVPVMDGWKPTLKRDNESKEVIDYAQYDEWLKSKGFST